MALRADALVVGVSLMNMSSSWGYMPELILVGIAFLAFMGMIGRQPPTKHRADDEPPHLVRWSVIGLLLVAALAHIPVIPEHLDEAPYMGVLFIAFTLAAFGVASVLAAIPSPFWYAVAGVLCVAAVVAYVATRLVAFPQLADDVGLWAEPLGLLSIASESLAAILSAVAIQQAGLIRLIPNHRVGARG